MKTLSQIRKLAEQHGCKFDYDNSGGSIEITVEAPEGKILNSSGCSIDHGIRGHGYINTKSNKPNLDDVFTDVAAIMQEGFADE
jgi:hypothetical protein